MNEHEELIGIFIEESIDLLERMRERLDDYSSAEDKGERFKDILRSIHTMKGGSGTCGFHRLKNMAHSLEEKLLNFKDHANDLPIQILEELEQAVSDFALLLEDGPDHETQVVPSNQGFGFFEDQDLISPGLAEGKQSTPKLKENKSLASTKKTSEQVRVPLEKIQRNIDLVSEIFLTRNQIKYLVEKRNLGQTSEQEFQQQWDMLDNTLRKSIGDLESLAMSLRMMPIKPVFRMMEATVREYAKQTSKQISLQTEGSDTDLDKRVLDNLSEPLIHLIRNAMDHGIENQETRIRLGKSNPAIIRLTAHMEGNEVIITVSDDGQGIDDKKLLESATRKGLDTSHVQTKDDAINLIFHPGFSTKQQATDVSGRGIGMDAVKNFVESIGGSIQVKTEINKGTQFCMRIPLGLSVIRALIAKVNGVIFAISSSEVLEIQRITRDQLQVNGNDTFFLRSGQFIPCHNIGDYLYTHCKENHKLQDRNLAICNIIFGGEMISLQVDELLSNVEIVVKPMPDQGLSLPYVTGVAILANGMPTFVVSLPRLYEKLLRNHTMTNKGGVHAA